MKSPANFKKLDMMTSDLEAIIAETETEAEAIQERIDELEEKQSDRHTEGRAFKLDALGDQRDELSTLLEHLESAKEAIENARATFDPA